MQIHSIKHGSKRHVSGKVGNMNDRSTSLPDFTEGILHFFNNISEHKDIISKRINDNFQLLQFA